ncbi:MAG: NAD-binding protein [Pseudomonadota bacterium]
MNFEDLTNRMIGWRWWAAMAIIVCALIGMFSEVGLTATPELQDADLLTRLYYVLGLFVFGGLDIGTPTGGPIWARFLLWCAFFGAPLLTASAVIEAALRVLAPDRWQVRKIRDHVVILGAGRITRSYLRVLREKDRSTRVVVVAENFDGITDLELRQKFNATPIVGDLTNDYLLQKLRLTRARRVLLLGDNDFNAFESATRILAIAPGLAGRIVLHCHNLRFMRSLASSEIVQQCDVFNTYNLAAAGFVHHSLVEHFRDTPKKDSIIVAGFGRFGQSVLEELELIAQQEIDKVAIVDHDADRRVLVVDEQKRINVRQNRVVVQGDIGHPLVWRELVDAIELGSNEPTVVLCTGDEQANLRTALWLKNRYPNAKVYNRTNDRSRFAETVGYDTKVTNISITELIEQNMPTQWFN